jgi:hypothetical protein
MPPEKVLSLTSSTGWFVSVTKTRRSYEPSPARPVVSSVAPYGEEAACGHLNGPFLVLLQDEDHPQ